MSQMIGVSIFWFLRIVGQVAKLIPYPLTMAFGAPFGLLFCVLAPLRVGVAMQNIKLVFPDRPFRWRLKTFALSMLHLGLNVWEWLCLPALSQKDIRRRCRVQNKQLADLVRRHGGLMLTAHMGNWEYMAAYCAQNNSPLAIIYRYFRQEWAEVWWKKTRELQKVELIPESHSAFSVMRKLGKRYAIGIMLDQHVAPPEGIGVPFFGHTVGTISSLATLQMRTHQYVFPVVCFREWKTGRFKIVCDGKIPPEKRRLEEYQQQVFDFTRKYNSYIEKWVKQHPEQWLWIHRRFKYSYDYAKKKKIR